MMILSKRFTRSRNRGFHLAPTFLHTVITTLTIVSAFVKTVQAVDWPVFFERLGTVHSIYNKWDLKLRVSAGVPELEERVTKVQWRLEMLDTDFSDPEDVNRRQSGPVNLPARLAELNSSWRKQNRQISIRCANVKRRTENIMQLARTASKLKRSASENDFQFVGRQAAAGSGVLQSLFGVAYTDDVNGIKSHIDRMDEKFTSDLNNVRANTNNIRNSASAKMAQQERELKKMEEIAEVLERKVVTMETNPFMKTSISDLVHSRNELYKKLALEVDLLEERLVEIETVMSALGSGKLSKSIISPTRLKESLQMVEQQLPENYGLLYPSHGSLWPYYSSLTVNAAFHPDMEDLEVTLTIPIVDQASVMELYKVHNLPLKVKDGYSVVADINTEYLVVDQSRTHFLELNKQDFQDCRIYNDVKYGSVNPPLEAEKHFYCGLQPMLRAYPARSCVMQLFQGQRDPAWCQTRLHHGLIQPFARLYNGSWIFAALNEEVHATFACIDGSSPATLVGFGVIDLEEGCTVSSEDFWYPHTFAGMMEVRIGFGGSADSSTTSKSTDDLDALVISKEEEEALDVRNFMKDVMFVSGRNTEGTASTKTVTATTTTASTTKAKTTTTPAATASAESSTTSADTKENLSSDGQEANIYLDILEKLRDTFDQKWILS